MSNDVDLERVIARAIRHVDADQLRDLLRNNAELEEIKAKLGPQNAEELWHWVKERVGVELSRVTVCEGHCSQLEMAWELYSFAVTRVLWVMSRGGGKTSLVAWIDECQAEHFPGWATFCVPMDAEILTRRGWLTYEELMPGEDETIGFNPQTGRSEWTPVERKTAFPDRPTHTIGNKLWKARVTEGHTWSVVDRGYRTGPKGPGTEEVLRSFEDLRLNDKVRLAARADGDGLEISYTEAAIIGWLLGDGHCVTRMNAGERRTYEWGIHEDDQLGKASILQAKPEGVAQLRLLLVDVPHTETMRAPGAEHHHQPFEFRIDPAWLRDLLSRARIGERGLHRFVCDLAPDQRDALLSGFLGAEGWVMEDRRYGGKGTTCFAQNEGLVLDAMVLCSYLCGYRPTLNANDRSSFNANAKNWQVMLCKPYSYAGKMREWPGRIEDVWCPTTTLGTWTMRWENQILLTGNTIGANQTQGQRKYEYLLPLVVEGGVIGGKELEHVIRSIATETQLKNGSKMEIARGSSPENANGPRVPRLHRDETELMDPKTRTQAGNIPAGRKLRDGRYAPAQILDTSTMKYAEGHIDLQIQDYNEAKKKGVRPRMEVRICCIFEIAKENPTCRSVPKDVRRARLIELGRDPEELCDCDTYVSDVWPSEDLDDDGEDVEPEDRTLESVCQGRFFQSRGYKGFDDIQTLFLENPRETWEAEQECSQPSTEGAYIKSYSQTRNGIRGYRPDPENGPIDQGIDWGADDEHAVIWFQTLEREVRVKGYMGGEKVMPVGAVVAFAEIYKAGIGNTALGRMVLEREQEWQKEWPGWRLGAGQTKPARYPDSANLGARLDWSKELGMETTIYRKDFLEELKLVRTRIGTRGGFFIDISMCPWFDKSIRAWRQENGREVRNFATHPMAAFRYREHNVHAMERRRKGNERNTSADEMPQAAEDESERMEERQRELARAGARGESVELIVNAQTDVEEEDLGIGGAEDSPLRDLARSMPGQPIG